MPIYEFYCIDCHTIFNFLSSTVNTEARPACPRCGRPELERKPSRFATVRGGGESEPETDETDPFGHLDDEKMEGAMASLAGEMEGLGDDENPDPRQLARFLRRFGETTGLEPGPKLQEMLAKLDAGADPDSLDDENADLSELFQVKKKEAAARARSRRPAVDETLYFL
jgi:putative FmdB family regulatory protein